jgi:nitrogen-specific signal transduction histidine kinase
MPDAHTIHSPLSHFDATSMLESLALPVLVLDRDCCVVFINGAARAVLHSGLRELQGRPLDLLFEQGLRLRAALSGLLNAPAGDTPRPMRIPVRQLTQPERRLALKAQVLDDELTGPHLLVQLARLRERKRRPVLQLMPRIDAGLEAPPGLAAAPPQLECA